MADKMDYSNDFLAFYRDIVAVEGAYGPHPLIPPFLEAWLRLAFPAPEGNPVARNIADFRTKKEGKTALASSVALYAASRAAYSEVVIASTDLDQSRDRTLRACKYAIEHGRLAEHAKIYRDVIELDNRSTIQALPADWRGAAGGNYSAVVFDELHAWTLEASRRMFDELLPPPTQPHAFRWFASYAGYLSESELLHEWWGKALAGKRVDKKLPIFHNREASMLAFVDTGPDSWRMPWMNDEFIAQVKVTERPNSFRRLWLNEWVSNESQFLPEGAWEACRSMEVKPITNERKRMVLGADASTSRDTTALVGACWNKAARAVDVVYCRTWKPKKGIFRGGKPTVDLAITIGAEVLELHKAGQVEAVIADPYQLHTLILEWQRAGIRVIELPQTTGRIEADQSLYDAVIQQTIRHYNDPVLNEHLRNAVALETPRGFRLAKERTALKIDAAVALSMAHFGAITYQNNPGREARYIADPFANWPPPDGAVYHPDLGYVVGWNSQPHPRGVTWQTCPHRMKGCFACYDETIDQRENEQIVHLHTETIFQAKQDARDFQQAQYWANINQRTVDLFWQKIKGRKP